MKVRRAAKSLSPAVPRKKWQPSPDGTATFADLGALRIVLGDDGLVALSACLLHLDRLTSLGVFLVRSPYNDAPNSQAGTRDLFVVATMTVGTLAELQKALGTLRGALHKKGLLHKRSPRWKPIDALSDLWLSHGILQAMRSQLAFHVDSRIMLRGLERLITHSAKHRIDVAFFGADGPKVGEAWFPFVHEASFEGLSHQNDREQATKEIRAALEASRSYHIALSDAFLPFVFQLLHEHAGWKREMLPWISHPPFKS